MGSLHEVEVPMLFRVRNIALALCLSMPCHAIEVDKAAHFGVAYAATTVTYGACKRIFHLEASENTFGCKLAAFLAVNVVGALKEASDAKPDGMDAVANALGSSAAIGAVYVFEF
jgi:hypothetical protein